MANYTVPEAVSFLRSIHWVEVAFKDSEYPSGFFRAVHCVHIVGVVLALPGVYEHPHFLTFNFSHPGDYPNEIFWDNIVSITPVRLLHRVQGSERANGSSRSKRANFPALRLVEPLKGD